MFVQKNTLFFLFISWFFLNSNCEVFECDNLLTTKFSPEAHACLLKLKNKLYVSLNHFCVYDSVVLDTNAVYDFVAGPEFSNDNIYAIAFYNSNLSTASKQEIDVHLVQKFKNVKFIYFDLQCDAIENEKTNYLNMGILVLIIVYALCHSIIYLLKLKRKTKMQAEYELK